MNTIEQAREVAKTLRLQAMEIAALGNAGWGNTMIDASNTIDALLVELERIKGQEPVGRIASNGYPELYKPHSLPAWTLLYLAAGAQPAPKQEPFDQDYEREQFEKWYCVAAFDFERDPIGSKLCGDQWAAWKERAKRAAPVQAQEQREPAEIERITKAYVSELDALSNRNYTLRMENAAQRKPLGDGSKEFKLYLADCDENAITPDVAGAFHAAWQAAHNIKEQP